VPNEITFILGAGASAPFGFPTGAELVDKIIENLSTDHERSLHDRSLIDCLSQTVDDQTIQEFRNKLKYSPIYSIDRFLSNFIKINDFQKIGKFSIAFYISQNEKEASLFKKFDQDIKNKKFQFENWYASIFNQINSLIENKPEKIPEVHINFITFNYDRSLEWFFHKSIEHSFDLNEKEAKEIFSNFEQKRIIHVHGSLGDIFDYSYGLLDKYPAKFTALENMAKNIKIVTEVDTEGVSESISMKITNSNKIYFLGFGYDPDNLKKIPISKKIQLNGSKFFGSRYGIKKAELDLIKNYFAKKQCGIDFFEQDAKEGTPWDLDCYQFIRNHVDWKEFAQQARLQTEPQNR